MQTIGPEFVNRHVNTLENYTKILLFFVKRSIFLFFFKNWSASWEICMQVRKQQLELDMEQQTGSK